MTTTSTLGAAPRPGAVPGRRDGPRPWGLRRLRRLARGHPDRSAVALLVAIPVVLFVIPACFGQPAIAGDNAIQNFPLRVLSGQLLASGHLPLWNPFIWSGSPLLGGLNAGALYPMTLVFMVVPAIGAWVLNLLVVYWAAGLGLYALARQLGVRPLAALLGALTYAFSGAMTGQMVHLPIIQGMAWVPLIVLAELRLSRAVLGLRVPGRPPPASGPAGVLASAGPEPVLPSEGRERAWPWVLLLAVLVGLVFLAGEPRGMAEVEIVAPVVALWAACRHYRGQGVRLAVRLRYLGLVLTAGIWAAVIGAAQLLPGWKFINASQRASETYWYFGSGSLHPSWTALLAVPDLFGGDGVAHQPIYFNSYNLPEVTGYVGLVPLVAVCALVASAVRRRRAPAAGTADCVFWCVLAGLGLVLAWGSFTPLGHLFWHIPLFGKTRLQSRNLGIVDLGLAMALAYWADRALRRDPSEAGLTGWRRAAAVLPPLVAALLCTVALVAPVQLETAFGVNPLVAGLGRKLAPWLAAQLVVALAVGAMVLLWSRWGVGVRRRVLCGVVVVDLVLFGLACSTGFVAGHVTLRPSRSVAASVLGTNGRFALFDTTVQHLALMTALGQPDLNTFTGLSSVQGYGSLVADRYGDATGTHTLDTLDACALASGTFTQLRLSSLVTLPNFLTRQVAPPTSIQDPAPSCPGAPEPGTPTMRTWYLGQVLPLTQVDLVHQTPPGRASQKTSVGAGAPGATGLPRVGVLGATGSVTWPAERVTAAPGGGWRVHMARTQEATGIVVRGDVRAISDTSTVTTSAGVRYELNGYLQDALGQRGWRFDRLWDGGAVFRTAVRPPVWIQGVAGGSTVRRVRTTRWGEEVDRVQATRPVTVVRSESALAGWKATAVPMGGGPARTLAVHAVGLVQGVRVPAGRWTLTFTYRPAGLTLGLVGSVLGAAAAIVAAVVLAAAALRRRRRAGPGGTGALGPGATGGDSGRSGASTASDR